MTTKKIFKAKFHKNLTEGAIEMAKEKIAPAVAHRLFEELRSNESFNELFSLAFGEGTALMAAKEDLFNIYGDPSMVIERKEEILKNYPRVVALAVKRMKELSKEFKALTGMMLFRNEHDSFFIHDAATALAAYQVLNAAITLELKRQYDNMPK